MFYSRFIAVNHLALEVTIDLVEVESVYARDEALCLEDVGTKFVDVACSTREITGGLDTTGKGTCLNFETLDIIGLPAMHAEMEILKSCENLLCVYSDGSITLFCQLVGFVDLIFVHFNY